MPQTHPTSKPAKRTNLLKHPATLTLALLLVLGLAVFSAGPSARVITPQPAASSPGTLGSPSDVASVCGVNLESMDALSDAARDLNSIFILLPGIDGQDTAPTSQKVEAAVEKFQRQGRRVGAFTLQPWAPGYDELVDNFGIREFPGVIVAGKGCRSLAVQGDFSPEKLNQAYLLASTAPASCGLPATEQTQTGQASCCAPVPPK